MTLARCEEGHIHTQTGKRAKKERGKSITSTAQHPCDLDELDGDFSGVHGRGGSSLFSFTFQVGLRQRDRLVVFACELGG